MLASFIEMMPTSLRAFFSLLFSPPVLTVITGISVALFALSAWLIPRFLVHLPPDYFVRQPLQEPPNGRKLWRTLAKNALGVLLLLAGLAMLVLPGQGILTLVVALLLLDVPGKPRFLRRCVSKPLVLSGLNRLRARFGALPFQVRPPSDHEAKE